MKAIVTGSTGFIGQNLVNRLLTDGWDLHCFDIKHNWDMFTRPWPKSDVIYHLACVNQEAAVRIPEENVRVNAYGAKFAAHKAKEMGATLIYTSTASVYGRSETIPTPVDADINPQTDYAVAKLAGEYFIKNSGCSYAIVRLSNVYGPYQTTDNPYCGVIGKFIEQALNDEPLTVYGDGSQTRDYSYVDDVIDILTGPLEINRGINNISRGEETSVRELIATLSTILDIDFLIDYKPKRSIDGIDRRRLITDYRCPTNLEDGLRATIKWYESTRKTGTRLLKTT